MIFSIVLTIVGTCLLIWAVRFHWWTRIRVTHYREALFSHRDKLWDRARELGCHGDPAYRQARDILNWNIKAAESLSLTAMIYLLVKRTEPKLTLIKSNNEQLQSAIDQAYSSLVDQTWSYLFEDTLTGRVIILFAVLVNLKDEAWRELEKWTLSEGPHFLGA